MAASLMLNIEPDKGGTLKARPLEATFATKLAFRFSVPEFSEGILAVTLFKLLLFFVEVQYITIKRKHNR